MLQANASVARGHTSLLICKNSSKIYGMSPGFARQANYNDAVDQFLATASMLARFRLGSMYYEGEKFAPDKAGKGGRVRRPKL